MNILREGAVVKQCPGLVVESGALLLPSSPPTSSSLVVESGTLLVLSSSPTNLFFLLKKLFPF